MSDANRRTALAALATARPVVARLDGTRDPEDLAADIIETWSIVETALRSLLGGSALSGQNLIKELRQRDLMTLAQAHGALELLAARDRAARPGYRPTVADATASRSGYLELEGALMMEPSLRPSAGVPRPVSPDAPTEPILRFEEKRARRLLPLAIGVAALVVVAGAIFAYLARRGPAALNEGIALYQSGQRENARAKFSEAARRSPDDPAPHIFLGRIAREEGDLGTALKELTAAATLDPQSAQAQRELGSFELATGQPELARRFYVRAITLQPDDKVSQGYLGCALARLGRAQEAQQWTLRAGAGPWMGCVQQALQAPPPTP